MATATPYNDTGVWSYLTNQTNTSGYWAPAPPAVTYWARAPLRLSPGARARMNLAFCREVSWDEPARLRPQVRGMKLEYFEARNRAGSSGRPGYRRRRVGGVVRG